MQKDLSSHNRTAATFLTDWLVCYHDLTQCQGLNSFFFGKLNKKDFIGKYRLDYYLPVLLPHSHLQPLGSNNPRITGRSRPRKSGQFMPPSLHFTEETELGPESFMSSPVFPLYIVRSVGRHYRCKMSPFTAA